MVIQLNISKYNYFNSIIAKNAHRKVTKQIEFCLKPILITEYQSIKWNATSLWDVNTLRKSIHHFRFKGYLRILFSNGNWNMKRMGGKYHKSTKVLRLLKCQPSRSKIFMLWKLWSHVYFGNYGSKYMWFKTFILNN